MSISFPPLLGLKSPGDVLEQTHAPERTAAFVINSSLTFLFSCLHTPVKHRTTVVA